MQSLRKSLLQFVFSGASMRRWNDKLRPSELYEVDKQGHKMITAFLLYRLQCRKLGMEEQLKLGREVIEGALFDYFYRLVITDIKPPVFYRIRENEEQYRQLTDWVLGELEPRVRPLHEDFWQRLVAYHSRPVQELTGHPSTADRILRAAHLYASRWEFGLIRPLNHFDEEADEIELSFNRELQSMCSLEGVPELMAGTGNALVRTANLCGQLRFQIRWSQTPRIPETAVLGHMFIVATYAYFLSLSLGTCDARALNNFFCGLFHDLPELLTRDIITPVKRSVATLPDIIHQCEEDEVQRRIFQPLAEGGYADIRDRLRYYLGLDAGSEFKETIRGADGTVQEISGFDELNDNCNANRLDPKDGKLIKVCDVMAAFMEAHSSIHNGISSPQLFEAIARIRGEYGRLVLGNFNVGTLLADFD